jgi:hypothetical protein
METIWFRMLLYSKLPSPPSEKIPENVATTERKTTQTPGIRIFFVYYLLSFNLPVCKKYYIWIHEHLNLA